MADVALWLSSHLYFYIICAIDSMPGQVPYLSSLCDVLLITDLCVFACREFNGCYNSVSTMKMTTIEKTAKTSAAVIPQSLLPSMKFYIDDQKYSLINAINNTNYKLQQSGWYYPHMTREQAKEILQERLPGSFLLRQSSESVKNYTLSIRTQHGAVVSIRIIASCKHGNISFRLDCSRRITDHVVEESCVVDLIQQLMCTKTLDVYRFSDNKGHCNISLQLERPVTLQTLSLKHLCRLKLHQHCQLNVHKSLPCDRLPIPSTLKSYLSEYANIV